MKQSTDETQTPVGSSDLLGTPLYQRALSETTAEHRELMRQVWTPTPWMLDVMTEGREAEMWHWCYQLLGPESSPIHGKEGNWHRANVTMRGMTWWGFKTEAMMRRFQSEFEVPNAPGELPGAEQK